MSPGKVLQKAVNDAHIGHTTSAQLVMIGMVLQCGGTEEEARQIARSESAVSMVSGQITNLREFARAHLNILQKKE